MKNIILTLALIVSLSTSLFAQRNVKSYQPAYVINTKTLERVAKEVQLKEKTVEVKFFLQDYPVLEDISNYSKNLRYSMIDNSLIASTEYDGDTIIYHLTNGKDYKIKKKNQTNKDFFHAR